MVKHLDDRRRCQHCGEDLNERPYVMSRHAEENVISTRVAFWVISLALLLVILTR